MFEAIMALGFVATTTVLTTAGWVLFLFFWLRSLPSSTRSLAAALLGSGGLLLPLLALGGVGLGNGDMGGMLLAVAVNAVLVGLPTALLVNRKLERTLTNTAAVFE